MTTVVVLALVTVFLAFRLYAVLGKRTGHEQQPMVRRPDERLATQPMAGNVIDINADAKNAIDPIFGPGATTGLRAIVAADPQFDPNRFLEGAQAAYRMILEAYWSGDQEMLDQLTGAEVNTAFGEAIAARKESGEVLDNRLITIERAMISDATLDGVTARIVVRFDADIAAVTRNAEGVVIAGSLSDAVTSHDVWTFSRNVQADDPNWILVDTDEAA